MEPERIQSSSGNQVQSVNVGMNESSEEGQLGIGEVQEFTELHSTLLPELKTLDSNSFLSYCLSQR